MEDKKGTYPKSVPYIIGNEAAERFNYYGIRAIMTTFLAATFFSNLPKEISDAKANEIAHTFVTVSYFTPLIGGLVADWFFGKYKVILYLSIVYAIGSLSLSIFYSDLSYFFMALMLIAIGAGGVKSCVSANVGDQFDKSNEHLLSKVYGWFYFSINAGSVISTALIPWLYKEYGASIAFGVPGVLMSIATFIFWLGRNMYVKVPPVGIKNAISNVQLWKENAGALGRVGLVFAFIPVYWALWDQNLSEWVLQARGLDRHVFGFELLPEQIQTINPFFLLALIPVFTYGVYPLVEKLGIKVTPLRKIGAGMFLTALSFIIIARLEEGIEAGQNPSVWWQILAYFILSAGEVMVSITGLEYAYTNSPPAMKGLMNGIWFLAVSVGNFIVTIINRSIADKGFFYQFHGSAYYWFFMKVMLINTVIFIIVAKFIKEKKYLVEKSD
jgi:proton-dependent oligopeptide transporter, POT family